jgi:predicted dehydrogenase
MEHATAKPIRIALLGADDATAAIARSISGSDQFELAGVCELDGDMEADVIASLGNYSGRVRRFSEWESLLDRDQADAVVVARADDEDRRADQLRKFIQTGVPVVTSHPVVDSMLVYYELDMIRRETDAVVVPFLPQRHHPALRAIRAMVAEGAESPIGRIEQVILQRSVAGPEKRCVPVQFARDVDLIRAVAGEMTRLGAMAGTGDAGGYAGLGVQMSGPSGVVARWSVDPIQAPRGAQLAVLGTRGKVMVEMREADEPWTMGLTVGGETTLESFPDFDPGLAVLDQLARALEGAVHEPDWIDAARSVELAETIDRSLEKGRTIELYYEDYTEQGTFKGTMTSIGCGLLILTLFLLGAVAIADHVGLPYARAWPYVLLGGLGVFLLLQLLMLVFGQDDGP